MTCVDVFPKPVTNQWGLVEMRSVARPSGLDNCTMMKRSADPGQALMWLALYLPGFEINLLRSINVNTMQCLVFDFLLHTGVE